MRSAYDRPTEISLLQQPAGLPAEAMGSTFPTPAPFRMAATIVGVGLFAAVLLGLSRDPRKEIAAVAAPSVERFAASSQTLVERDTRLLAATAAERLDAVLDPLFSDFHNRVPAFGEWAFGWRTGYRLLREGMLTAITLPFVKSPRLEQVNSAWDELIATKFDELVLHPAGGIPALRSAHERWLADMRPTVDAVIADTVRTVALLHGQTPPLQLGEESGEASPTEEVPILSEISTATGPIKARTARPLLARLTIRPPVAAAVTAAGEAIGNQGETLLGGASTLAATIVAFLSIDYMLSQTDASIHRAGLEAEVHRVLENQHQSLRSTWLAEEQAKIDTRLARVRPLLNAGDANPLPNSVPVHVAPETDPLVPGQ
ncbi:hypothetical protein CCP3SC15_1050008 [Gammaproteobacteria bacterium]